MGTDRTGGDGYADSYAAGRPGSPPGGCRGRRPGGASGQDSERPYTRTGQKKMTETGRGRGGHARCPGPPGVTARGARPRGRRGRVAWTRQAGARTRWGEEWGQGVGQADASPPQAFHERPRPRWTCRGGSCPAPPRPAPRTGPPRLTSLALTKTAVSASCHCRGVPPHTEEQETGSEGEVAAITRWETGSRPSARACPGDPLTGLQGEPGSRRCSPVSSTAVDSPSAPANTQADF